MLEDLVGEGNLGLIRAAEEFDPDFGTRFSTYASHWVKQTIQYALINTTAMIRVPAYMAKLLTKWRRTEQTLCVAGDHMPDFEEVASSLSLSEVQKSLVREARRAGGIKLQGGRDDVPANLVPDQAKDRQSAVEATVQADDEVGRMMRGMENLDERERTVLALRYGLDGAPLAYKAIGARLGFSGEWARKIESGAIRKLGVDQDDRAGVRRCGSKTRRACGV
jgi:RNA polymerase primary sigma factor